MASPLDDITARLLRTRRFVRAPIWLYRHHLGRLFGERMLMLEHRGRTTGLPRFVCLEAIERPSRDTIVVASGFGTTAQWYQNLQAHPDCRVSIGARFSEPATAVMMSPQDADAVLDRYQQAHPAAWRRLRGAIEKTVRQPVERLPMVRLTLA
ncbi:nitroreductase family deazaflavin-dependent oxidoreductase [Mycolicibacterium sp. F2034L]|uniref:nitroreductase family deazaflavin-dependent oxidoreductase n=1 Tax=Mycolicibacterium sp. F2034L TaxID=2926422 RepID=UPI001FF0F2BC|nr:nitroreductase family deazaflavin-dependent oxidoreductase [Mycolicibacterium sp. F2034L]MCK0174433.1 nitroreductase family deazaflavin-dependent oxidoreductase [Mycolicibacterium sp. F2034L]